jgi:hypothetical protein
MRRKVGRPRKVYRKSNYVKVTKHNRIKKGEKIEVIRCPHCHSLLVT